MPPQPAGQPREHLAAQRLGLVEDLVIAVVEPDHFAQVLGRVVVKGAAAGGIDDPVRAAHQHQRGRLQPGRVGLRLGNAVEHRLQHASADGALHQWIGAIGTHHLRVVRQ
ncbi:hypothetical protein D3C86_1359610 [compost metagenome]